jgi:hypothetical protein
MKRQNAYPRWVKIVNVMQHRQNQPSGTSIFGEQLSGKRPVERGCGKVTLTPQEIVDSWEKGLKVLKAIHHQAGKLIDNR